MEIYIAKSGRESGPFTEEQIKPMLDSGMIELTDSVWHKELDQWIQVYQFLGMRPPLPMGAGPDFAVQQTGLPSHGAFGPPPPALSKAALASGDPAPFARRLAAHVIDSLFLIPAACITLLAGWSAVMTAVTALFGDGNLAMAMGPILGFVAGLFGWILPIWLYHAWKESSPTQASIGKQACGLIVVTTAGERPSFKQAGQRAFGKGACEFFGWGVIFLTCLLSAKRQCLHDMRADCMVVVK